MAFVQKKYSRWNVNQKQWPWLLFQTTVLMTFRIMCILYSRLQNDYKNWNLPERKSVVICPITLRKMHLLSLLTKHEWPMLCNTWNVIVYLHTKEMKYCDNARQWRIAAWQYTISAFTINNIKLRFHIF